jgi:hypothetical protein
VRHPIDVEIRRLHGAHSGIGPEKYGGENRTERNGP